MILTLGHSGYKIYVSCFHDHRRIHTNLRCRESLSDPHSSAFMNQTETMHGWIETRRILLPQDASRQLPQTI